MTTDLLTSFRTSFTSCTACSLRATATQVVPWRGPTNPTVAVLGLGPGEKEDAYGLPFVGPAGKMLTDLLSDASIDPDSVAYLNTVSCWPRDNRPLPHHIAACRPWLRGQLAFIDPTYLIVLGDVALRSIVGESKWSKLSYLSGRPLFWPDPPVPARPQLWITRHPSWALRSSANRQAVLDDLLAFQSWRHSDEVWPTDCTICHSDFYCWDEEGWGVALCERHEWRGKQRTGLRHLQSTHRHHQEALVLSRRSRVGRSENQWWDQRLAE